MRVLYHYMLCPFSRKIRLLCAEKKLDLTIKEEEFWKQKPNFLSLNPLGQVPVLIDINGTALSDSTVIAEYLEETYLQAPFMPTESKDRAEVRRLVAWIDTKFAQEVTLVILFERILKKYYPDTNRSAAQIIRQAKDQINPHFEYMSTLLDRRNWLGGKDLTIADFALASHISTLDYFGDINWNYFPLIKEWYVKIKSRPAFRQFLNEKIPGRPPVPHYIDLDF